MEALQPTTCQASTLNVLRLLLSVRTWRLMTASVPQPLICGVSDEFSENVSQLWKEFVWRWIAGAFGLLSTAWAQRNVLLRWANQEQDSFWPEHFILRASSTPVADAVLCAVFGLLLSAKYRPFACLYMPYMLRYRHFTALSQTIQALPTFTQPALLARTMSPQGN